MCVQNGTKKLREKNQAIVDTTPWHISQRNLEKIRQKTKHQTKVGNKP